MAASLETGATVSHPRTRAQGLVSSAHQLGLQQAPLTTSEEGMKDLKLVISLSLHFAGCCYYFLDNFATQHAGADKAGKAREISQHAEEACPSPPGIRNEAEI